jgi:UDP-N-acetylmuramate--alanine ligase
MEGMKARERVHMIGIGGSGLSAIARVLLESGQTVSGSDRQAGPVLESLRAAGAQISVGHRPENVLGADLVIRSSAIPDDHVEVQAAREQGIPVLKRSDYLGRLVADRRVIAVAGSHGKTTTTAMIAWILSALGLDPAFIVGGTVNQLGVNARAGKGPHFVIEADEYDHMFLGLEPFMAVVTNIEHDHPDCFSTPQEYFQAFQLFAERLQTDGTLLCCGDDPGAERLLEEAQAGGRHGLAYGLSSSEYSFFGGAARPNTWGGYTFDFNSQRQPDQGLELKGISLQVPGLHNVRNAVAALAVADLLGLSVVNAAEALGEFQGTGRRFDLAGEAGGVAVIDDYAHHPTEIRATLEAARSRFPERSIWALWQPHTFSRTRTLLEDFSTAFQQADHVVVTEIYAAREAPPKDGFSGRNAAASVLHPDVHFTPDFAAAERLLLEGLRAGDVLLTLSAGDADQLSQKVLQALAERNHKND